MKKYIIIMATLLIACTFVSRLQAKDEALPGMMNDTSKVILLNEIAYKYYMDYYNDSCLIYASLALSLSDSLLKAQSLIQDTGKLNHYKFLKATSLMNFARGIHKEKPGQALDTLQIALKLMQETGNKEAQAIAYGIIGWVYDYSNDHQNALVNYHISLALFRESGNLGKQADQLLNIGISLRYMGNYGDATEKLMESLKISREINDSTTMVQALLAIGFVYMYVEKWEDALKSQQDALEIYEHMKDSAGIATIYNDMGLTNFQAGKLEIALEQHKAALNIRLKTTDYYYTSASYSYIGLIYEKLNLFPEAIMNYKSSLEFAKLDGYKNAIIIAYLDLGNAYLKNSEPDPAFEHYMSALELSLETGNRTSEVQSSMNIANYYILMNDPQKALAWLKKAEKSAPKSHLLFLKNIYLNIAETYAILGDYKNAYLNQKLYDRVKDSIVITENMEKITTLTNRLEFENKQVLQNENHSKMMALNQARIKREKMGRNFSLLGMLVAFILVIIVFVRFVEKKKLNTKLNETLANLKSTQSQLVHAEKMASLGELTAGIAHEIQNPLNFVNNFSEVNVELLAEMKDELDKDNFDDAKAIANDAIENQQKILHHGKRADAIVKGMLQHSRTSTGQKELTDINALADEYLRLAYHGLRAKDKSFNAAMKTDFDVSIGNVNVITQDIGRVILNLITNAFYAVSNRNLSGSANLTALNYKPTVIVSTKNLGSHIEIRVKDNGNGIPEGLRDKIFQPFFTTKPTGQGTGLGLSLSYDIVKAHGGELKVETKENEGTEFIIILPV